MKNDDTMRLFLLLIAIVLFHNAGSSIHAQPVPPANEDTSHYTASHRSPELVSPDECLPSSPTLPISVVNLDGGAQWFEPGAFMREGFVVERAPSTFYRSRRDAVAPVSPFALEGVAQSDTSLPSVFLPSSSPPDVFNRASFARKNHFDGDEEMVEDVTRDSGHDGGAQKVKGATPRDFMMMDAQPSTVNHQASRHTAARGPMTFHGNEQRPSLKRGAPASFTQGHARPKQPKMHRARTDTFLSSQHHSSEASVAYEADAED